MILDSLSQPKEVMTMNLEQIVPIEKKKWHEVRHTYSLCHNRSVIKETRTKHTTDRTS